MATIAVRATWELPFDRRAAAELGLILLEIIRCADRISVETADIEGFMMVVEPVDNTCAKTIINYIKNNQTKFVDVSVEYAFGGGMRDE